MWDVAAACFPPPNRPAAHSQEQARPNLGPGGVPIGPGGMQSDAERAAAEDARRRAEAEAARKQSLMQYEITTNTANIK